ncbi:MULTISPECIES: HAD-IB family hydrolase [unclassified Caulobacter]|uniref:HAD-IB family hydrolase n=1 Tax=unclassified Caulobacter TaxID=2648921 RepID=UPI000783796D|nr:MULTISPECIES: HAD-IB family hydrolase [unclassified Caulobacter]AZS21462.1 HAD-IB family hydrolase [Caulobacter sp. FWC26]
MAKRSWMAKGLSASRPMTGEMGHEPLLVAFDFDGTLTVKDSFNAFLKWRAGPRWTVGVLRLTPALLTYVFDRNRAKLKAAAVREFLKGATVSQIENDARAFAEAFAPLLLRPDAVAVWRSWRAKGAKMVIVTASPDLIVAPFARGLGADMLIGTRLRCSDDGRILGGLDGNNCRAKEKVIRLREVFGPDVRLTAAYGDTSGDTEMLAIADEKGYRVFRGRPA